MLDKYRPPRCRPWRNYTKTDHLPPTSLPNYYWSSIRKLCDLRACGHPFFFKALAQNFRTPLDLDRDPFRLSSIYTYIASLLRNLYLPPHRALHQTNPCSSGIHTPFEVILICKVGHLTSPHANSNRDLPRPWTLLTTSLTAPLRKKRYETLNRSLLPAVATGN